MPCLYHLKWATKIAERYMGKKNAKAIGETNSGEGSVLVRIRPTKIVAKKILLFETVIATVNRIITNSFDNNFGCFMI